MHVKCNAKDKMKEKYVAISYVENRLSEGVQASHISNE
jgi:hypothetical protein